MPSAGTKARPEGQNLSRPDRGLRAIAIYEAAKGVLALLAATGLLFIVHRDLAGSVDRLVEHLHLNPASRYPRILLNVAAAGTPRRIRVLAAGVLLYAAVRFAEAVGLWREQLWAEWLGVVTGGVYILPELLQLVRRPSPAPVVFIVVNAIVMGYLVLRIQDRRTEVAEQEPV